MKETREKHPSFGVIGWSRQHTVGGHAGANLFGSDLKHSEIISLRISTASRARDLSNTWIHADKQIVEVNMSATQFADFLTSPNMGDGVPCTIRHTQNEHHIEYPSHENETQLHKAEFKETLNDVRERSGSVMGKLKEMGAGATIKKGDFKQLKHDVEMMIQEYHSNLPFVMESFERSMEKTVSAGKAEIEAYIEHRIRDAGLDALTLGFTPPEIVEDEFPVYQPKKKLKLKKSLVIEKVKEGK
jgi:hypothetical protein